MTIEELAKLYRKIQNGEASELEKVSYEIGIRTSCMNEKFLRQAVEKAAEENNR